MSTRTVLMVIAAVLIAYGLLHVLGAVDFGSDALGTGAILLGLLLAVVAATVDRKRGTTRDS